MELQESGGNENELTDKNQNEDLVSKLIGDFGRWQLTISVIMALLKLPVAWYQMNIIFLAPPQTFWCRTPEILNRTDTDWQEMKSSNISDYSCTIPENKIAPELLAMNASKISQVKCENFIYDLSVFQRTIISDWDLVCSNRWFVHLSQILMMCGILLGGILFGAMADRYGRKYPLMVAIIVQSIASFISGVAPVFWAFLVNRFILALATGGIAIVSLVLSMEVVSGKWRTIIPVLCQLPFGLGNAIMAGIAFWLRDWRKLQFGLGILSSMFILCWFWIPESPRWLLARGHTEKALEVLQEAAHKNNKLFNTDDAKRLIDQTKTQPARNMPRFKAFYASKNMRQKTILLCVIWLSTGTSFYAFAQYLGSVGDNIFVTVATSGIISMPGMIACVLVISKIGRKTTIAGFQLLTTLCFVLLLLIPKKMFSIEWPRLLCAGIGMAGMGGSIPALYLFTAELYPTVGRNVGVGGVTLFTRIGSMIAPLFVSLDEVMKNLTLILLAAMSLAQILLIIPLPETKGSPLPATLEEAEAFTRSYQKICAEERKRIQKQNCTE